MRPQETGFVFVFVFFRLPLILLLRFLLFLNTRMKERSRPMALDPTSQQSQGKTAKCVLLKSKKKGKTNKKINCCTYAIEQPPTTVSTRSDQLSEEKIVRDIRKSAKQQPNSNVAGSDVWRCLGAHEVHEHILSHTSIPNGSARKQLRILFLQRPLSSCRKRAVCFQMTEASSQ